MLSLITSAPTLNDFSCNWKKYDEEIKFSEIFHAPFMIADDSYNRCIKKKFMLKMDWHRLQLLNFRRLSLMIIIFFVKRKWPEKVVHHGFSWLVRNMEVKLLETDEVEVIFVCLWNRNWTLNWDVFFMEWNEVMWKKVIKFI